MNSRWKAGVVGAVVLLAGGCVSTQELRQQRDQLAEKLETTQTRVAGLEKEREALQWKVQLLTERAAVLAREKDNRIQETAAVRHEARRFVRDQAEALREFSRDRHLIDVIGGEIIDRANLEGSNLFLLDVKHPFPSGATLIGARLYARAATRVSFCLVRPSGKGYVVMWRSRDFDFESAGIGDLTFDVPVAAQAGDLFGLYAPDTVQVPFDVGTGDVRPVRVTPEVGKTIQAPSAARDSERAYSFSAVGFLD